MATIDWLKAASGDWSRGSNWVGGIAPGPGDDAVIEVGGTYTVTISTAVSARSLTFDNSQATIEETRAGSLTLAGALVFGAGTFALNAGTTTVGALTQSGGEFIGAGRVAVSGTTILSGGGMEGGDSARRQGHLEAQGQLIIAGGTALDGGWTLTADGTTDWTSGTLYFGYNPGGTSAGGTNTFVNAKAASFDDQNAAGYEIDQYTGTGIFDNAGLFDKTAASGGSTTTITTAFDNSGTLEVDAGTVELAGGGTDSGRFTGAGVIEFAGGASTLTSLGAKSSVTAAEVLFAGGTTDIAGHYDVSGSTTVGGGTANFRAAVTSLGSNLAITGGIADLGRNSMTVTTLTQSGGSLADTGAVTASGTTLLSGGGMEGGSSTARHGKLVAEGALLIAGGTALDGGWTVTADGTTDWTSGTLYFGYDPVGDSVGGTNTFVNAKGASFADQDTAGDQIYVYSGTGIFDNAGLFDKTAASGGSTTTVTTAFDNSGTLEVDAGTVDLTGGGTDSGRFTGVGAVEFAGGTTTLEARSSVTAAEVLFAGGTTDIAGHYDVSGSTTVSGGTANFSAAVTSLGSNLAITGGVAGLGRNSVTVTTLTQSGGSLADTGTVTVSGTTLLSGGGMEGGSSTARHGRLAAEGLLVIAGGYTALDGGFTVTADGTTDWTSGTIYFGYDPAGTIGGTNTFVNAKGASFDDQDTGSDQIYLSSGTGVFDNAGLFDKTAASGGSTTTISIAFDNSGTLEVQSGTLSLTGTAENSGLFEAAGGTLDVENTITGVGRLIIGAGSEIELGCTTADAATFNGNAGTLRLDNPASYSGTLSDFVAGDALVLGNTDAISETPWGFNGTTTTLTVGLNEGGPLTFTLAGNYSDAAFSASFNGSDTTLTLSPDPPGPISWESAASGGWSRGSNWVGGIAPGPGDDAVIAVAGTYTVTISTAVSARSLTFDNSQATIEETRAGSLTLAGALVFGAGTFALNAGTTTVGALTQSGGEFIGAGRVAVSGTTILSGGGMEGGDSARRQGHLEAQGQLIIAGGTALDGGWTLTADGTTDWTSGTLYFGYNPGGTSAGGTNTFVNAKAASFDDQNAAGYEIDQYTGTGIFDNAGLFDKTAASGGSTTTITTAFDNSGTLEVDAGTVELAGGGTDSGRFTGAGVIEFAGGASTLTSLGAKSSVTAAEVLFAGGTTDIAGHYDVSGSTTVGGGTANFRAAVTSLGSNLAITGGIADLGRNSATVTTLTQSGGSLANTGAVTVSGTTLLSGGGMEGGSSTARHGELVAEGALLVAGGTALDGGWTVTADGTTDWTSGYIYFGYNPVGNSVGGTNTFVNAKGASFADQDTAGDQIYVYSGTGIFDNAGLFDKTAASGGSTTTVTTAFDNSGTLEVDAGTVDLTGGTDSGRFTGAGAIEFAGGTTTLEARSSVTAAEVLFAAGTTDIAGHYDVSGGTTVSGGTANFGAAVASLGGNLAITGGVADFGRNSVTVTTLTQSGGSLADTGTVTVSGTTVLSGGGLEGGSSTARHGRLAAEGLLVIAGGYTALDGGFTVTADGTTDWTSGTIYFGYNPVGNSVGGTNTFVNAKDASFDDQDTSGYGIDQYTGTGVFDNAGLFDKTAASGGSTTTISTIFDNRGRVEVQSGALDLAAATNNSGVFEAAGGTLDVANAITGAGRLIIGAGSEIELGGATAEAATFNGKAGTLMLDAPATSPYTGTIADFKPGDILELANTVATRVTSRFTGSDTILTVHLSDGGVLTYRLAGNLSGDSFPVTLIDAGTDSDITVAVPHRGGPVITAPAAATVGVDQPVAVHRVSVSETGNTPGETFTVALTDRHGALSATTSAPGGGGTISGSGTTKLTITGTLAEVDADLTTLTADDPAAGLDKITVNARDSFGKKAIPKSIDMTVNGLPTIAAPATARVEAGETDAIHGVKVRETGNTTTSGETFTVVLADRHGVLSANTSAAGGGGMITPSHGGKTLTITGTLAEIDADLTTLTDDDPVAGSDRITIDARDSFSNKAPPKSIAVTATGVPPVITSPPAATVGVDRPGAINGVRVSDTGKTADKTFTVVLTDRHGLLSANTSAAGGGGTITPSNDGKTLTITGTLAEIDADLTTVTDDDRTVGVDKITIDARDSFGQKAIPKSIDMTVNGLPTIAAPATARVEAGETDAIHGVKVRETGNTTTSGETFTVVLADRHGVLSANTSAAGGGGMITPSHGGKTLTITGTLAEIDADLTTLTDDDPVAGSDRITIDVRDSFGNKAPPKSIAVTATGVPPVITAPPAATVGVDRPGAINGIRVSDTSKTADETFTVVLTDRHGLLSANASAAGGGGTITPSNDGKTLTITGTLAEIDADLTTVTDDDRTVGVDKITINARDSFGQKAIPKSIDMTVNGRPAITAPPTARVEADKAEAIHGVKVSETGNTTTSGETFTVVLSDRHGILSADTSGPGGGGMITASNGSKTLTITGTLAEIDADLTTLTDDDPVAGSDRITIDARDSFGNKAPPKSIAVTVTPVTPPTITVPAAATVGMDRAGAIHGVRVSDTSKTADKTFTVVLTDRHGLLSANASAAGGGGTITPSNDGKTLTITGTLAQINADLTTLTDDDPAAGSDRITINARDSFGNKANRQFIAVTVNGRPTIRAPARVVLDYASPTGDAISGVSIAETGNTASGEIFTVVLTDRHGILSASTSAAGGGGTIKVSNGGKTLTIAGTLAQVDADLATLTDDDPARSDRVTIQTSDSFGNDAKHRSIGVTVKPDPPGVAAADLLLSPSGEGTTGGRMDATRHHGFRGFVRDWTTRDFSVSADPIGVGPPSSLMHALNLAVPH